MDMRYPETPRLTFKMIKCSNCGLIYLNPRPNKEFVKYYYPDNFYNFRKEAGEILSKVVKVSRLYLDRWNRKKIIEKVKIVERWSPVGKLLDVGCAAGEFLNYMKKRNWDVNGVEISPDMCRYAEDRYKIDCFNGDLLEMIVNQGEFDVITFWASLEHLYDPLGTLRKANKILRPGGKIVVLVPNAESLEDKWFRNVDRNPIDVPRHLYHFSPSTLERLFDAAGFKIVRIYHFTLNATDRLSIVLIDKYLSKLKMSISIKNILLSMAISIGNLLARVLSLTGKSHTMIAICEKCR
jgi:2-polyprenyl-3-methyl-5-hydroxy-6-metoxy-1,4-benzoquinol methylase